MRFDTDIVVGKLLNIQDAVSSIRRVDGQRDTYADGDVDDLQVLHLQRAIQAAIDVAQHLIAANAWEAPDTSAQAFVVLVRHGVLPDDLLATLRNMVGFRNIAVHRYGSLDPDILHAVVAEHLDDFDAFVSSLRAALGLGAS